MNNSFDIAIIGMSCRFPGANDPDSFWNNLANGIESISHFTDEELREAGIPDSLISNPNYVKAAPIIDAPGMFDAKFFGFTPMEAKNMDPQHRVLLECAHQALEHSGYNPEKYSGKISVFTGSAMNTYFINNILRAKFIDEYIPTLIGNDKDFLSTRISYKLNLTGPSINVQTACSTSLVAVHLACQSLITEESDMALAGAVSVKAPHKAGYICDGGGIVSPDGHVRAFDKNANGTVFGSGCGIIILKRLSDAIKDNDTIHAVIKGSAINNDGSEKAGYTAPGVNSQAEAIIEALSLADINAETITYIEAHGSGTPIGDPIELAALTKAFRNFTNLKNFCAIGSVKTNVGHLDAVAGMAGLIKTILSLKNKKIPPTINYSESNPEIDIENSPFYVMDKLSDWKSAVPRRSGIMSTGMGGTNAFLILEEAPKTNSDFHSDLSNLLVLSAKSESALDKLTAELKEFLKKNDHVEIRDAAYTLQQGRKAYNHRRFVICKDRNDAIETLTQENSKRIFSSKIENSSKRPVIFLFPGIGDHYVGMGYDLYQKVEVFKEAVDKCASILNNYIDIDIREVLYPRDYNRTQLANSSGIDLKQMLAGRVNKSADKHTQRLNQTLYAQPALFTIEYALAKLWINLGIKPDAIVGHSMGEYTAAYLAGVFSLEDALRMIAIRAKLVNELPEGRMLAVTLAEKEIIPLLGEGLSISLINSPNLCVVAGADESITQFEQVLNDKSILYRQVQNAHAFHSKMLDPIFDELANELKRIKLKPPQIPYTSNLTGNWISENEATNPIYWAKHATHTARFSDALEKAWKIDNCILLEVGPGNTLGVLAMQHPESKRIDNPVTISSLRPGYNNQSDLNYLLNNIGKLWLSGVEIDWNKLYENERPKRIPLPTYPFQKENYWIEANPSEIDEIGQRLGDKTTRNEFRDWFYISSWKRSVKLKVFEQKTKSLIDSNWLVFSSGSKFEKKIINELKAFSCKIIVVEKGKSFSVKDDSVVINHRREEDYKNLYKELNKRKFYPNNILHFWNYDRVHKLTISKEKLESSLYNSIYSLFFFAKNLKALDKQEQINLGIITNNLHNILGEEELASPETSMILGPARVINKEIENVFCRCIDFPNEKAVSDKYIDQLLSEFISKDGDEIIAYRGDYRWFQSFEKVEFLSDNNFNDTKIKKIKSGGVYLITGGTGGLGLIFAEHFAQTEKVRLILTKRSDFPERSKWQNWIKENDPDNKTSVIINKIMKIEALGSTVDVQICDISDENESKSLIAEINKRYGIINGVIHAAGNYEDKLIFQKSLDSVSKLISPKLFGTINLYKHLKTDKLDFFVLCSSISSITPPAGQFDYSAVNIYMDAFASYLNSISNLNLISINWYAWRETGILPNLKVSPGLEKWKEKLLEKAILNSDGVKALTVILNNTISQVIVSPEPLKQDDFKKSVRADFAMKLAESADLKSIEPETCQKDGSSSYCSLDEVEVKLTSIWQEILGVKKIKNTNNFFELGGHSLLVIQLLSSIRKTFNIDIDFQLLFEASTLEEMAANILEKINKS